MRPRSRPLRVVARYAGHVVVLACWLLVAIMAIVTWGPHVTRFKTDIILGMSMEPTIPLYSVIVVEPVAPAKLRVGDVITFQEPDLPERKVTHRIAKIVQAKDGALTFVTKGDNNATRDPWRVTYAGTGWRVRGHAAHVGWILLKSQTRLARILLVVLPVLLLLGTFLRWVWADGQEEEELEQDVEQDELPWDLEPIERGIA